MGVKGGYNGEATVCHPLPYSDTGIFLQIQIVHSILKTTGINLTEFHSVDFPVPNRYSIF